MDEQSEWEYEYDPNETEDLYFTLDLTTYVPDAIPVQHVLRNGKRVTKEVESLPVTNGNTTRERAAETQPSAGTMQFLDLHTDEPLVRFKDRVYSCNWHTDLGTQFYVARPGHVVDVVATSQARLLGAPVKLRQRKNWVDDGLGLMPVQEADLGSASLLSKSLTPSDLSNLQPGEQLVVPRESLRNAEQATQASFLEQLSAIKLQKGEHDIIPVAGVKHYIAPANKEEIRLRAVAAAAAEAASGAASGNTSNNYSTHGKKRRRMTYAEMGIETLAAKKKRERQERKAEKGVDPASEQEMTPAGPMPDRSRSASTSRRPSDTVQYELPQLGGDSMVEEGEEAAFTLPWADLPATISPMPSTLPQDAVDPAGTPAPPPVFVHEMPPETRELSLQAMDH
ncbi:hypothetical protein LTR56_019597 [Elasticomyces elasticus]|nr:hypothetical protein LTR56_019597 [Elasticomyces elasticus]KAK3634469.1 hypothetical protein LTR22_019628 [Elasticomyces elasticus]KAK4917075.1 hypothetical protein LTR49_014978 [Elasticomyces elasticus]